MLSISTDVVFNKRRYPPSLRRIGDWGGYICSGQSAADKLVAVMPCPHTGCGGWIDAITITPEVVATGSIGLCSTCRRAPTSGQVFPASYIALGLAKVSAHPGTWVPCGHADCQIDIGAGPGLMWRWDANTQPVWHGPDCLAGRAPDPELTNERLKLTRCQRPGCSVDTGYGPGTVRQSRYGHRKYHRGTCDNPRTWNTSN